MWKSPTLMCIYHLLRALGHKWPFPGLEVSHMLTTPAIPSVVLRSSFASPLVHLRFQPKPERRNSEAGTKQSIREKEGKSPGIQEKLPSHLVRSPNKTEANRVGCTFAERWNQVNSTNPGYGSIRLFGHTTVEEAGH